MPKVTVSQKKPLHLSKPEASKVCLPSPVLPVVNFNFYFLKTNLYCFHLDSISQAQDVDINTNSMATADSAITGKNYQDTFHAIYRNVMTEESTNDTFHANPEPAKTLESTQDTSQANVEHSNTGETSQDTSHSTSNDAEPPTMKQNPEPTKTEASSQITAQTNSEPAMENGKQDIFHGWLATDATSPLKHQSFTPKTWEETDIDIRVTHCGLCASDLNTMRSGWGETLYPVCCGHEIVGTAIRVGEKAREGIRVGDRVGVGPQGYNCHRGDCECCVSGRENYCPRRIGTYGER